MWDAKSSTGAPGPRFCTEASSAPSPVTPSPSICLEIKAKSSTRIVNLIPATHQNLPTLAPKHILKLSFLVYSAGKIYMAVKHAQALTACELRRTDVVVGKLFFRCIILVGLNLAAHPTTPRTRSDNRAAWQGASLRFVYDWFTTMVREWDTIGKLHRCPIGGEREMVLFLLQIWIRQARCGRFRV